MKKEELLKFLEDEEIKKALKKILKEEKEEAIKTESSLAPLPSNGENNSGILEKRNIFKHNDDRFKKEVSKLTKENEQLDAKVDSMQEDYNNLQTKNNNLQNDYDNLQAEYSKIQNKLNNLQTDYNNLQTDHNNLQTEYDNLQTDHNNLQTENNNLQNDYNAINAENKSFKNDLKCFLTYNKLQEKTKTQLEGIFKNNVSPDVFFTLGTTKPSIENLFEIIKHKVVQKNHEDISELRDIYYYFIDVFNRKNGQVIFKLENVNVGDSFNPLEHTKCTESSQAGTISEIYVLGYDYLSAKQPSNKQTIVKVEA